MNLVKNYLPPILISILGLFHSYLFVTGYRLTADDVSYHMHAMSGFAHSWQFIKDLAFAQGRIVHFPDLITSLTGAYFADYYSFRMFYVFLYFLNFFLVSWYSRKLSGINVAYFILLILFSFHPLDYFHLTPNSYPFKISFPIALILVSRIRLLYFRQGTSTRNFLGEKFWLAICFFAMMFSEYAFTFAFSLMCIEFATRIIGNWNQSERRLTNFASFVRDKYFLNDIFLVFLFLFSYVSFRLIFPSAYEGNKLPEKLDAFLFIKTLIGHIYGGTTFSSFSRYGDLNSHFFYSLDLIGKFFVLFVFTTTFVASAIVLDTVFQDKAVLRNQVRYAISSCMALFSAVLVTVPIAITTKYQTWCQNVNSCAFLDSSLSYLGFGVFLAFAFLFFSTHFATRFFNKTLIIVVLSVIIGAGGSLSHLNNLRIESDMRHYVSGWNRAQRLACSSDKTLRAVESSLPGIIDPHRRISVHPDFDIKGYWIKYIENQKSKINCGDHAFKVSGLYPKVKFGTKMVFSTAGGGLAYLATGWSNAEAWGTWSDGKSAEIILPFDGNPQEILIEAKALVSPSHPAQNVSISLNNVLVANTDLRSPLTNLIKIAVPISVKRESFDSGVVVINLKFANAIRPSDLGNSGDNRILGVGLLSLTVR